MARDKEKLVCGHKDYPTDLTVHTVHPSYPHGLKSITLLTVIYTVDICYQKYLMRDLLVNNISCLIVNFF